IRAGHVTGVQTCALPISASSRSALARLRNQRYVPSTPRRRASESTSLAEAESYILTDVEFLTDARSSGWYASIKPQPRACSKVRSEERRVGNECGSSGWV